MFKKVVFFTFCMPHVVFGGIKVEKPSSIIHVENGGYFSTENQISNYRGKLIKDAGASLSGGQIIFNDGSFVDDEGCACFSGNLDLDHTCYKVTLDGNKKFEGMRGLSVREIVVQGKQNRLEGVLQMIDSIDLLDMSAGITCALQGRVHCDIALNGGEIFLEEDLHFVNDNFFTGSGVIFLNGRKLGGGTKGGDCDSSLYISGDGIVDLTSNLLLTEAWTFSGDAVLSGNNKILCLGPTGEIIVEKGSSLLIQNVRIKDVCGNNVRCLDNNATMSLQNATFALSGNYSFTTGTLDILQKFHVEGPYTFAYQSTQICQIGECGAMSFDRGVTFSFDPIWDGSINDWSQMKNRLVFAAGSSILELRGATLHATSTSLQLTKGILKVQDKSRISAELEGQPEGISIGNNNALDDLICEIDGGAVLEITEGALTYKNVLGTSWEMYNKFSTLSVAANAKLRLDQSLDVGNGMTFFAGGSTLARATGKKLNGTVYIGGPVTYEQYSS